MAQITKPISLNETSQDVVTKLQAIVVQQQNIVSKLDSLLSAVKPNATDIHMSSGDPTTVAEELSALNSNLASKTNVSAMKYPTVNLNRCTVYRGGLHKIGNAVFLDCIISSQYSAINTPKMLILPEDCKPVTYTSISVAEVGNGDGGNIEEIRTGYVYPDGGLYINTTVNGKFYYLAGAWVNL